MPPHNLTTSNLIHPRRDAMFFENGVVDVKGL
jgi:hypothetical protein